MNLFLLFNIEELWIFSVYWGANDKLPNRAFLTQFRTEKLEKLTSFVDRAVGKWVTPSCCCYSLVLFLRASISHPQAWNVKFHGLSFTLIFPKGSIGAPALSSAFAGFTYPKAHAQSSAVHWFAFLRFTSAPSWIKLKCIRTWIEHFQSILTSSIYIKKTKL